MVGRCQEFQAFNTSPRAAASHATLGLYGWSGTQILVFCPIVFRLMNLSMSMREIMGCRLDDLQLQHAASTAHRASVAADR